MRIIAKKPCSFGGQQFFVGDEIPKELIIDAEKQEKYGVVTIAKTEGVSGEQSGTFFTQEQVDEMVTAAVAELKETEQGEFDGTVQIAVKGESDGENEQLTAVPATPEDIQKVFEVLQLNADEGAKAIAEVKSESVLILLHAVDARKTIKDAAKKQADNLFSTNGESNESHNGNDTTGTNTGGADT